MRKIIATDKAPAKESALMHRQIRQEISSSLPDRFLLILQQEKLAAGGIAEQTRQSLENIKAILEEAGSGMDKVIKTTCFLNDIADFSAMNEVYAQYFTDGFFLSRSAFEVAALPKGALVEIEAIALK